MDKFILGGKEFDSRFILGSGKFSLELVKACIEKAMGAAELQAHLENVHP